MIYRVIVVAGDLDAFNSEVNLAIIEGWQLQGGVSVSGIYNPPDETHKGFATWVFAQAVTKAGPDATA